MEELRSIALGTAGLTVAAAASLLLAVARVPARRDRVAVRRVRGVAAAGVVLHVAHFAEEWHMAFHVRFPELLGLAPWSSTFFVTFNLAWLALWCIAIGALAAQPRVAMFPLWFLAIASLANGLAHPVMAWGVGGYFPGLWTSPLVGIVGVLLLRALVAFTRPWDRYRSWGAR